MSHEHDEFPTDADGLPPAAAPETVYLRDGDVFDLSIRPVRKRIGDAEVRMLGYDGSVPGPTLRVAQGSELTVRVTNEGDVETTVHWHGLRLENRYDGVPGETQAPISPGEAFTYRLRFPDAGLYWYHPHIREDFAQEMGLYAPIIVEPSDPSYWPAADRQLTITLNDVLIENGRMAPFRRPGPNFVAMGRFGNVMLTNGEAGFSDFERAPDKTLSFVASMPLLYGEEVQPASSYVCPMHPEVTASEPSTCPKCGMKLVPSDVLPAPESHEGHAHGEHQHGGHTHGGHDHGGGLE